MIETREKSSQSHYLVGFKVIHTIDCRRYCPLKYNEFIVDFNWTELTSIYLICILLMCDHFWNCNSVDFPLFLLSFNQFFVVFLISSSDFQIPFPIFNRFLHSYNNLFILNIQLICFTWKRVTKISTCDIFWAEQFLYRVFSTRFLGLHFLSTWLVLSL